MLCASENSISVSENLSLSLRSADKFHLHVLLLSSLVNNTVFNDTSVLLYYRFLAII